MYSLMQQILGTFKNPMAGEAGDTKTGKVTLSSRHSERNDTDNCTLLYKGSEGWIKEHLQLNVTESV